MTAQETLVAAEQNALNYSQNTFANNVKGGKKSKNGKIAKASAGIFIILILTLILGFLAFAALPILVIATIDYGLQGSLGFDETVAIMEEQGEYITAEQLSKGSVPKSYYDDLAAAGINVGQVTASGDFVRTSSYIANIDMPEIASVGNNYQIASQPSGELAVQFNGEIITASNFVAAVESNPTMYAAYSKALNISAKYYYSDEVQQVYKDLGLSRGNFNSWQKTGDKEADTESFYKILETMLDKNSNLTVNGYDEGGDEDNKTFSTTISNQDDAANIVQEVSSNTTGDDATAKAAELLNVAISASEPYLAASAFIALEEPIQRARFDGDGPVDEVMDLVSRSNTVTNADGTQTTGSILRTQNFLASISEANYSTEEAKAYSRDRVLDITETASSTIINDTTTASNGRDKSNILVTLKGDDTPADYNVLSKVIGSVSTALTETNSTTFASPIGANRIVEGGSFLSNTINSRVLGAMPSSSTTIANYHREVETVLARKAAAERATLSPFDISSPNTFFGGIVRKIGSFVTAGILPTLLNNASADGNDSYTTTFGDCSTVKSAANVEGDLYCTAHNTMDTSRMANTMEDWQRLLSGSIDMDGKIADNSPYAQFVALGMDRETTIGVESSDVCERWKDFDGNLGFWGKITDALSNVVGLYRSCRGVDKNVAIGSYYALSEANLNNANATIYSGYTLYQTVSSLMSGEENQVTAFKERYYAEHPLDNSAAGKIARISGLTKDDAQIALDYFAENFDRIIASLARASDGSK